MKLKINKLFIILFLFLTFFIFNGKTSSAVELPTLPQSVKEFMKDKYYFIFYNSDSNASKVYNIYYVICENNYFAVGYSHNLEKYPGYFDYLLPPISDYGPVYILYYNLEKKEFYNVKDSSVYKGEILPIRYLGTSNSQYFDNKNHSVQLYSYSYLIESNFDIYCYKVQKFYNSSFAVLKDTKELIFENNVPPEPETPKVTPTLYIDDQNLKKRFKFQFEIPLEKEDTKYYVFLQKYTRNSYDSVTATFTIYTVSTPEGYDATNYENYMYYDLPSKGLYLPAGTVVKWYNCTINNGSLATLNLFNEFVPAREKAVIRDIDVVEAYLSSEYFSKAIEEKNDYLTLLVPTKINVEDFNPIEKIREFFFNTEFSTSTSSIKFKIPIGDLLEFLGFSNLRDFHYFKILSWFYYADPNYLFLPFDDLAFSNFSIVSYENSRISNSWTSPFYNIYRKTKVYDQENKIDDSTFVFNYSDGQDVSSLLPADMNKDYLTSPFFKDNENSTSKGNITYDINEIIQGDKIIDYSKEDNSIHNNFNGDYIENFKEGDNITINNYYTETIEKTSDSHLLHNIYIEILEIKTLIASMDDFVSNETNNFTYNTENNIKYYLIPSKVYIKQNLSEINSTAKKNLGIIYEPVEFLIYTVTLFSKIDSTDDIILNIPDIEYKNTYLLHSTTINFTSQMQNLPILGTMHNIYLTCVDFVILGLLIAYAIKVSKEVFNK